MKFSGLLVLGLCLAFAGHVQAQNSLEQELSSLSTYKAKQIFLDSVYLNYYGRNWDSAVIILNKSLNLAKEKNDTIGMATNYSRLGISYYEEGKYKEALDADLKAFELYSKLNNKKGIARSLNEVGTIYDILGDSDKALENLMKSLEIRLKLGDKADIYDSYNNIGVFYYYQGDYDKALKYYEKARATMENPAILNNIGEIYYETGKYKKALAYFQRALNYLKDNVSYTKALVLRNLGLVFYKQKEYPKAIEYIEKSNAIARKTNSRLLIKENYAYLTDIYKEIGDFKKALVYKTKFSDLKDSLFKEAQVKAIADMNAKFQVSVKEKENEILKKNLLLREQEIKIQKILSFSIGIILLLFIIAAYVFYRGKQKLSAANRLLTEKNEEIRSQAEELTVANEEITSKNKLLEAKNKKITESISYAESIQSAVLDYGKLENRNDIFILNLPKDIVSGDFFYMQEMKNNSDEHITVITVADCTGHGVPGALMSMLGTSFLNEIIKQTIEPDKVLEQLRARIKKAMKQQSKDDIKQDGMDIAFCTINHDQKHICYSGANNPLYLIRKNNDGTSELISYKADRQPVGAYIKERPFTKQIINYTEGDIIYMFSDGYRDQFGHKTRMKFSSKEFKKLIKEIAGKPMQKQKKILEERFFAWKGTLNQTDDVLVIGYKLA